MLAIFGYGAQAVLTGVGPYENLKQHLAGALSGLHPYETYKMQQRVGCTLSRGLVQAVIAWHADSIHRCSMFIADPFGHNILTNLSYAAGGN